MNKTFVQLLIIGCCLLASRSALAEQIHGDDAVGTQTAAAASRQTNDASAISSRSADSAHPAGVGILVTLDKNSFVVQYVLPDMPAAKANVQVGDVILSVDGVSVDHFKTVDDIVAKIRGNTGSEVKLKVRSGEQTREITLIRGAIPSVKPLRTDNFGREVAVYFYQFEDLVPASESGRWLFLNHDYGVGAFLRSQLRRNQGH
ncbi:MAG TPA: PDZ domain-containing protein [Drouetiella sp.]